MRPLRRHTLDVAGLPGFDPRRSAAELAAETRRRRPIVRDVAAVLTLLAGLAFAGWLFLA